MGDATPRGEIELRGVAKSFGPTQALAPFSHVFAAGRVHALMGKNGSGKSTLIKLLAGAHVPDAGELRIDGTALHFADPHQARAAGIATIHQELSLVPSLSVAENLFLGHLPRRGGLVDWKRVHADARVLLDDMGLDIDPRTPVERLSLGRQQVVEIAKAMASAPTILLLDEPTSALAQREVALLFAAMRRLRARGVTMLYITHRMNELFEIADTCTVLRDGQRAGVLEMADATPEHIVELMFGDVARAVRPPRREVGREVVLRVEDLHRGEAVRGVSFDLHRGEILGFAGLLGAGRTETLRAIFGADPPDSGRITLDGVAILHPSPPAMKRRGLGYTPEDRKAVGLVQLLSVHDNLCLASLGRIAPGRAFITRGLERPAVARQIAELRIKVADPMQPASSLSGGNQQKIVIGNWLNTEPRVMFFDEPSRGIDVQAKQQIFEIMWRETARGLAAIFVSSEPEELLDVADRILVMREGRIAAEVFPNQVTLAELYRLCLEQAA